MRGTPKLFDVCPPPDRLPKCEHCGKVYLSYCGGCGQYHYPDYAGDCRNDAERFTVACCEAGDGYLGVEGGR
jgi:hypothetical protein